MAILAIVLASLGARDLPTGPEVVARYVEAKGGQQLLRKTTSYRLRVEIHIDGKKSADSEVLQAKNRHLTINTLADGSTTTHGTDGKTAWYIDPEGKVHQLKGSQLADYLRHYTTVHEALEWPKQFTKIECINRKQINGKEVYQVEFTPKDGRAITRYFSVDTGLFLREVQKIDKQGTEVVSDIADYRRVKGVLVPHKRTVSLGRQITEYRVRSAENNVTFSKGRFEAPKSTR